MKFSDDSPITFKVQHDFMPRLENKLLFVKDSPTMETFEELREFYDPPSLWEMTKFRYKKYGILAIFSYPLDEWLERKIVPIVHNLIRTESQNYLAVQKYNFVLYSKPWWFKPACKIQKKLADFNRWLHKNKLSQ